jgi:hypothetical protein
MNRPTLSLPARGLTVAAGLALLVSLFLTWSNMSLQQLALLAVTANGNLGRLSLTQNAWDVYPGVAAALTAVALLVIATGVLNRLPLVLPTGVVCLAALVFVVVQLGDPPSALPGFAGAAVPSSGVAAHSTTGTGEVVALVALVVAGIGLWAMLAVAQADRRRRRSGAGRRRRQRATVSAGRSSRGVPAGEPADGSA